MKKKNLIEIWKNKGKIIEGIKNSVFTSKDILEVYNDRISICKKCDIYDTEGVGCIVKGTQPCCNINKGGCGCSLKFKTKSLSSECPLGYWKAVLTLEEESLLTSTINK